MIRGYFASKNFRIGIVLWFLFLAAVFPARSWAAVDSIADLHDKAKKEGGKLALTAHPNVEPLEKVRPTAAYMLSIDDIKEFPKYEKLWKEIFQIR